VIKAYYRFRGQAEITFCSVGTNPLRSQVTPWYFIPLEIGWLKDELKALSSKAGSRFSS